MNGKLVKEIADLTCNLRNGCRVLLFKRTDLVNYNISSDQIILLAFFYALVIFSGSYLLSFPEPEISIYGLENIATHFFAVALAAYIVTRVSGSPEDVAGLFVVLFCTWPWFYLVWLLIGKSTNFSMWQFYGDKKYFYIVYNVWMIAVITYATSHIVGFTLRNIVKCLAIYLVVLVVPLHYLVVGQFWNLSYDYDSDLNKYASVNQENTYYKQFGFLENLKINTLAERPGISDIYFVGFGSYSEQDVFMKEVQYAKKLFDERFDTKGRSVALINNLKTFDKYPLASKNNLDIVLEHIGKLVNANEDVLFLYLTSHGSREHELSIDFMPLQLNSIDPQSLKKSLDNSGIKYRVLLISACYSGGFVGPLKDEYTLIMTASAADRTSFGCGNNSEFTYFGKAVFEEQLNTNYDFVDAFNKSIESIKNRELKRKFEQSRPQLFVGKMIRKKLDHLRNELEQFSEKRNKQAKY